MALYPKLRVMLVNCQRLMLEDDYTRKQGCPRVAASATGGDEDLGVAVIRPSLTPGTSNPHNMGYAIAVSR
ncbi:hypothetical protein Pcinc_011494 [Petrolisthes cinctipes]|uniref:Uncharacterized protein n=1 Tax=Petrolisthes cinctipes TaxID=88211 RepID=A0AAE1KH50_PETCI|nr:hypothetical protein Pcinc_019910 [Petrolisthes cinctipes]KAK3884218.1 hypothetical protein Pcinc_011494 [Petrolisthes cinctipes]